jgi:YfiH family protein
VPARPNSNPHSRRQKSRLVQPASASQNALEILRAPSLAALPWLVHGFSTRRGGVSTSYGGRTLNLGLTPADSKENVARNRALFLEALGAASQDSDGAWPLVQMKQMHSAVIHRVSAPPRQPLAGDGVITNTPGLLLAIKTADCVPVLVADVKRRVVGAFHAGWRGTAARIVEKGVGEMRRQLGSVPRDLRAAIGPSIRRCCYQVGPEVRAEFDSQFSYSGDLFEEVFDADAIHVRYPMLFLTARAPGHSELGPELHLDLVEASRRQLEDAGLRAEHISIVGGCTACDTTRFFSHRAEFGNTGRMMAAIGVRPE